MTAHRYREEQAQIYKISDILTTVTPGDPHSWETEFKLLWGSNHWVLTMEILDSISKYGFQKSEPIVIGTDGRLWDGHHRLVAAHALLLEEVPVIDLRIGRKKE